MWVTNRSIVKPKKKVIPGITDVLTPKLDVLTYHVGLLDKLSKEIPPPAPSAKDRGTVNPGSDWNWTYELLPRIPVPYIRI